MTERITVSCPDGTKERLITQAHEHKLNLSQFMTKSDGRIDVGDELWDQMAKAVEKGDYKNVSALVRIAVVELLGGEK